MSRSFFPFVSVVIPTHNRAKLLQKTVESLFNQNYPSDRYEIIIVDNASDDQTEELIRSMQHTAPCPLKYILKKNEGPGSARNLGILNAAGEAIAFTDSDCVADRNWLLNGTSKLLEGYGLVQGKTIPNPEQNRMTLHHTMDIRGEDGFYATCNMLYWKEILDRIGGFSPDYCGLDLLGTPRWGGEDTDLAWRVKKQGWKSVFAVDAVVFHHVFPLTPFRIIFAPYTRAGINTLPRLVRRHSELRDIILYKKIFKHKRRALFYLFLISLTAGHMIHAGFLLLIIPYVGLLLKKSFYRRPFRSYHRGLALFSLILITELVHAIFFIFTSMMNRTIVL